MQEPVPGSGILAAWKPSCSDTLMPCVPAVSQQRAHEEAAPPHSTSRLQHGDPWLGWGQQGLSEEEPRTCSVQVHSPPGLVCSPPGSPTLSLRGWRDGHQSGTLEGHHPSRARGSGAPAGREPATLHKQQEADTLKEHSSGGGGRGSSWVSFYRAERWTWGSSAPLLVWAAWEVPLPHFGDLLIL